ncbi:MAG: hypothetical protein KatS3mg010_1381 [Acidimicrobiia bacterium]|nr:MAG: hypothetical protein KatS3mg010_1381 [Acidimicrobiia bacterium]
MRADAAAASVWTGPASWRPSARSSPRRAATSWRRTSTPTWRRASSSSGSSSTSTPRPASCARRSRRVAERFEMEWAVHDLGERDRIAVLVSRQGHCLVDPARPASRSTSSTARSSSSRPTTRRTATVVERFGVPFEHVPERDGDRVAQERELAATLDAFAPDVVVLARYMRILPPWFVERWHGRMINIHHSFPAVVRGCPAPYLQAHERGVKVIGATAHYVTAELDEGPIIAQQVMPVSHRDRPGPARAPRPRPGGGRARRGAPPAPRAPRDRLRPPHRRVRLEGCRAAHRLSRSRRARRGRRRRRPTRSCAGARSASPSTSHPSSAPEHHRRLAQGRDVPDGCVPHRDEDEPVRRGEQDARQHVARPGARERADEVDAAPARHAGHGERDARGDDERARVDEAVAGAAGAPPRR